MNSDPIIETTTISSYFS